jgi:uncharacterized membrane protein YkoI
MELDGERGRLLWEVDVASSGKDHDVKLNARSGKVVRVKVDISVVSTPRCAPVVAP